MFKFVRHFFAIMVALATCLLLGVFFVGSQIAPDHSISVSVKLRADPESIAELIRDVENYPTWRSGVQIDNLLTRVGTSQFTETVGTETIQYRLEEQIPGEKFVATILDENLPFGGTWTFKICSQADGSTLVVVREDGVVRDPIYRFFAKYVFGYERTLSEYVDALARHFETENQSTAQRP